MRDVVTDVVNRANQRGGRMLSVVDLIERETLTLEQASWLLQRILEGSSFLVGASPGGAGKTAVMGALLTMLPPNTEIYLTTGSGWKKAPVGSCLVAYELNDSFYEAYIWGNDVKAFANLGTKGRRLVSNLHADSLEEAREQVVSRCGATEEAFRAFSIFIPITVSGELGRRSRVVERVFLANHQGWREAEPRGDRAVASFLDGLLTSGIREIEAVRAAWIDALAAGGIATV